MDQFSGGRPPAEDMPGIPQIPVIVPGRVGSWVDVVGKIIDAMADEAYGQESHKVQQSAADKVKQLKFQELIQDLQILRYADEGTLAEEDRRNGGMFGTFVIPDGNPIVPTGKYWWYQDPRGHLWVWTYSKDGSKILVLLRTAGSTQEPPQCGLCNDPNDPVGGGSDSDKNKYGIDPDGMGPQHNPCDTLGPMCSGG